MIGFQLNERQEVVFYAWQKTLNQEHLAEAAEEDCCCASPFTFEYWPTGIGDHIKVRFGKNELNLSIDDDNVGAWPARLGRKLA